MADLIQNQTDIHAVIVFKDGELKMVVPDVIPVVPGQTVQWIVVPPNTAEIKFKNGETPLDWDIRPSKNNRITGTVQRDARGEYKYSVTDGQNTIDPRLQIKG